MTLSPVSYLYSAKLVLLWINVSITDTDPSSPQVLRFWEVGLRNLKARSSAVLNWPSFIKVLWLSVPNQKAGSSDHLLCLREQFLMFSHTAFSIANNITDLAALSWGSEGPDDESVLHSNIQFCTIGGGLLWARIASGWSEELRKTT